jgi:hypothetical protein
MGNVALAGATDVFRRIVETDFFFDGVTMKTFLCAYFLCVIMAALMPVEQCVITKKF